MGIAGMSQTQIQLELKGRKITLVGTAHVSKESVEEVKETIKTLQPDCVAVELDEKRADSIQNADRYSQLDLVKVFKRKEGFLLLGAPMVALYDGTLLDAVHLDGFLALRDGGLEVALAHAGCRLAGADVHGQYLVEVVLVPFALCLFAFAEGHLPVVERVVVGGQGVIGAHGRRVLLRGAGCEEQQTNEQTGVARQGRRRALPQ